MSWIVIGEDRGRIKLVSKSPRGNEKAGILPKGSFLTIEGEEAKFILRVDDSIQHETFQPSPMVVDMDLSGLYEDSLVQNIVSAYRIKDISERVDGKIDFIPPQSIARRSLQHEIDEALGGKKEGPKIFLSTVHAGHNQLLVDDELNFITTKMPKEMFFHQMQLTGKTGSGKTVAMKYLAHYFVEEMEGAVLAINVKDVDFLRMDQASESNNKQVIREWKTLGKKVGGVNNCVIYYPANTEIDAQGVNLDICTRITLDVNEIEPEALTGLLQNITEIAAQSLPNIFRFWQQEIKVENDRFAEFVTYFQNAEEDGREF